MAGVNRQVWGMEGMGHDRQAAAGQPQQHQSLALHTNCSDGCVLLAPAISLWRWLLDCYWLVGTMMHSGYYSTNEVLLLRVHAKWVLL